MNPLRIHHVTTVITAAHRLLPYTYVDDAHFKAVLQTIAQSDERVAELHAAIKGVLAASKALNDAELP